MFRKIRILILLFVLLLVAWGSYLTKLRTTAWDRPLTVAIYPINADGSSVSRRYLDSLTLGTFDGIESFFSDEARRYGLSLTTPVDLVMGPELTELPPEPPRDRNILGVMWWSLKMRFWARGIKSEHGPPSDIQMFVLYHDPKLSETLPHSLGLQKGLLGVVHVFAASRANGSNNMVIAHELLHTVGATDKYAINTLQPLYPIGYAEPDKKPVLPQDFAEIMAGRIPRSETEAEQPVSLDYVVIGTATALEIRWID
ncbi:hypothetical protein [Kaarinaea lacus]